MNDIKLNGIADDLLILNKITVDRLFQLENCADCIALYVFYCKTAKWQKTDTVKANDQYVKKSLKWGISKIQKTKQALKEHGLIDIVQRRKDGKIEGWFIKVSYLVNERKADEIKIKMQNINNTQNQQVENCTSGIEETNALKENIKCLKKEIEMLKDNKKERKPKKQTNINNTQNQQVENCTSGIEETNALKENIKCLKKEIEMLKDNKKERKPKKQTKSYDEQITEYTQNEDLQNALKAFLQMRSFIKKPMTEYALKLMLKKLDELGNTDDVKIAILNQSITHNWQGIFPLKDEYIKQEKQSEKKYDQNGYESEEDLMKMFYGK